MNSIEKKIKVITFGTFDLLHIGHVNIFRRAKELGDYLVVGVSTDQLNYSKKNKYPIYHEDDRINIVKSVRYVDDAFFEESLEQKREYIIKHQADILVMGDDWQGKFDFCVDLCRVVYFQRTEGISTSETKDRVVEKHK